MGYSYDRTAATHLVQNLHKAPEADDSLGSVYRSLVSLKQSMDAMEEIPSHILPIYKQTMKAMDEVAEARKYTYQLREMVRRFAR